MIRSLGASPKVGLGLVARVPRASPLCLSLSAPRARALPLRGLDAGLRRRRERGVRHRLAMILPLLHLVLAWALSEHARRLERVVALELAFHGDPDIEIRHVSEGVWHHAL